MTRVVHDSTCYYPVAIDDYLWSKLYYAMSVILSALYLNIASQYLGKSYMAKLLPWRMAEHHFNSILDDETAAIIGVRGIMAHYHMIRVDRIEMINLRFIDENVLTEYINFMLAQINLRYGAHTSATIFDKFLHRLSQRCANYIGAT